MASNRPSLLDDDDLASVGAGKSAAGRSGAGRDNAKLAKIGAVIVLFTLAIVAGTYPMWKPEGAVTDGSGRVVQPREFTPEDEEMLRRQERELDLLLEKGGTVGTE